VQIINSTGAQTFPLQLNNKGAHKVEKIRAKCVVHGGSNAKFAGFGLWFPINKRSFLSAVKSENFQLPNASNGK